MCRGSQRRSVVHSFSSGFQVLEMNIDERIYKNVVSREQSFAQFVFFCLICDLFLTVRLLET